MVVHKSVLRWITVYGLIVAFIVASGCLILPIPTLDHGEGLTKSDVDDYFVPGQTTRIDMLLTLGDPDPAWRKDYEAVFYYYHWVRRHGYTAVIPLPIFVPPAGFLPIDFTRGIKNNPWPWEHHAYLALKFTADGKLVRYQYWTLKDTGSFPYFLEEWMKK
jgi:hypothetical protein